MYAIFYKGTRQMSEPTNDLKIAKRDLNRLSASFLNLSIELVQV